MDGIGSVQGSIYSAPSQACRQISPEPSSFQFAGLIVWSLALVTRAGLE